ncbi:MAG: PD-(D/E)XK nuclease family protein, partial [Flavobacteriaceae bacterium]
QFLNAEKKLVSAGNSLCIEALEHPFTKKITHPYTGNVFLLKGKVDRIDCLNGKRRIIDYKTGAVTLNDVGFSSWEEVTKDPKKSALFQVLLYAYSLHDNFIEELNSAGVIPLKSYNTTYLPLHRKESISKKHNLSFDFETLSEFEIQLFGLLDELFDSTVPFTQKLD